MFKINLHAHTRYSDGADHPSDLIKEYKRLDFSCAVITDHIYPTLPEYSLTPKTFEQLLLVAEQVSKDLDYPVIVGAEYVLFGCEEVLLFGVDFIREVLKGVKNRKHFKLLVEKYNPLIILCHPNLTNKFHENNIHEFLDGFEKCNAGSNMFMKRMIPQCLQKKKRFSNSDAHSKKMLHYGYNYFEDKIENEGQLISYVKDNRPVKMMIHSK